MNDSILDCLRKPLDLMKNNRNGHIADFPLSAELQHLAAVVPACRLENWPNLRILEALLWSETAMTTVMNLLSRARQRSKC